MQIFFVREERNSCTARIHRPDGVVVELPAYSRKHRVPHDLVHAVAEREFGIAGGIFGSLAAGALFDNTRVVAGKQRHDAAARSARILRANDPDLKVTEILAGVLHHAVEDSGPQPPADTMRHDWGIIREDPMPYTEAEIAHAVEVLRQEGQRWAGLAVKEELEFFWPDRLVRAVPAPIRSR